MEQRGQGCGCCFGFVLGIVVLIVVVFSWFRWQGGTAYGAAVALQLEGQCERALPQFREVASTYSLLSDLAESAKKQISLCEALLAADQARNSGRWLEAVQAYQRTAKMAANSPFEAVPLGRLANLQAVATADATTLEACRGIAILDALVAAGETLSAEARAAMPVAVFSCGRASDNANNFRKAADMYRRVVTDYPNHPTARDARRLWADAEVNAAAGTPAGLAPPPVASGRGPAGVVTIEIINDSPESLELFFSGPSSDVIVLGPCASCPKYQTFGPLTCPARGPRTVLTLRPGTYRVHVRSRDGLRVTPYNGTWTLESGTRYSECYYIVESFRLR
jgi:tetratricopeptide (TPR) repeat protein